MLHSSIFRVPCVQLCLATNSGSGPREFVGPEARQGRGPQRDFWARQVLVGPVAGPHQSRYEDNQDYILCCYVTADTMLEIRNHSILEHYRPWHH